MIQPEVSRLRHLIGYVPQDDIIHRELTVEQALTYAARLRLPADSSSEELTHVVDETLDALDLTHRRDVVIGQLSGGQRKRVSAGVELLSRPGVLVPLPEMNTPTQLASMLTAARWGNQACEATVFDGRAIEPALLKPDDIRPLWNLYPNARLNTDTGRTEFLTEKSNTHVEKSRLVWQSFAILALFLGTLWAVTCLMLRCQNIL